MMSPAEDGLSEGAPCRCRQWWLARGGMENISYGVTSSSSSSSSSSLSRLLLDLISVADFNGWQDVAVTPRASSDAPPAPAETTTTEAQGSPAASQQSAPWSPKPTLPPAAGAAAGEDVKWLSEIHGWLMVVAVQIAAAAYLAGINPPGGLWRDDLSPSGTDEQITPHAAGRPVARDKDTWFYAMFKLMNMIAFFHSLIVVVLLMKPEVYSSQKYVVTLLALVISAVISMGTASLYSYRYLWPNDATFLQLGFLYMYCASLLAMFIFWRWMPAGERVSSLAWAGVGLVPIASFLVLNALGQSYPLALLLMICWCVFVYLWI